MAGTKQVLDVAVVLALLIDVFNQQANGRTGGDALKHTRQKS